MDVTRTGHVAVTRSCSWILSVATGPSRGLLCELPIGTTMTIGSAADNTLVLEDPKVSRHHLEIVSSPNGLVVRDLESKNGTFLDQVRIHTASLPTTGALLVIGDSQIAIAASDEPPAIAPSTSAQCGRMIGQSEAIRRVFAWIEQLGPSTTTVLLQGETGTGKELAAEALHAASGRAGPFVIVDCGSIPSGLIESELFGHVRGAFTGAITDRPGAFERAHRGTVFLDEIGELSLELQPRLLRVVETGKVKRVGSDRVIEVDVRIVAASLRDLEAEVAASRFRADLYFRLAVAPVVIPPLRERRDDIPLLVEHFCTELGIPLLGRDVIAGLVARNWPGNLRELRNVVERSRALAAVERAPVTVPAPDPLHLRPYKEAKGEVVAEFTRDYLVALLRRHNGNVSAAAREAKLERDWIVALAKKYDIPLRE